MGDSGSFTFKSIMFALAIILLMPIMISLFVAGGTVNTDINDPEVLKGYEDFTGSEPAQQSVWVLTGIYTPFGTDENGNTNTQQYGYTDDGWLYGASIMNYTPSQYAPTAQSYTVTRVSHNNDTKVFRYVSDTAYGNHKAGDLYTNVTMDVSKQSKIFFSPDLKQEQDGFFYYDYTGYRYSFAPTSAYRAITADGENIEVVPNTTSLSLIWYSYYTSTGISGQLIISGQDKSVAYLTAAQIISAFDSTTSSATFNMNFMGIEMGIVIRIDATYLANGMSVKDCYENGYWSVMVTSKSADASAYLGSDYAINPANLWQTMVDLFTFNTSQYGLTGIMGLVASFLFIAPLYAMLVAICVDRGWQLWVGVGILAAVQAIASFVANVGTWDFLGGLF